MRRLISALGPLSGRFISRAGVYFSFRPSFKAAIELLGFAAIAAGVGWAWGLPAALITGGIGAILVASTGGEDADNS